MPLPLTSALLTYTHTLSIQQMDSSNALVGIPVFLQSVSVKPRKKRSKVSLTNSFSPPGRAEFAMGIQTGQIQISGIVDVNGYFDLIWTTLMDNPFFGWCIFGLVKPAGGLVPLQYGAKTQWEEAELDWTTSDEGKVGLFTAMANISGSFIKSGGDQSAATVVGAAS